MRDYYYKGKKYEKLAFIFYLLLLPPSFIGFTFYNYGIIKKDIKEIYAKRGNKSWEM